MFIPLQLNVPLLVGGLISHFVGSRSKDTSINKARRDKGTLIASGFIAGGALMGVVSAILKFNNVDLFASKWYATPSAHWLSLAMYLLIIAYFAGDAIRGQKK